MIHLLFSIIVLEMTIIMLLLFRTPLRKLVILGLDRLKRGRGPVVVTTVGGTILILLVSSISSVVTIQHREIDPGTINPTDQVLFFRNLLDASLMGMKSIWDECEGLDVNSGLGFRGSGERASSVEVRWSSAGVVDGGLVVVDGGRRVWWWFERVEERAARSMLLNFANLTAMLLARPKRKKEIEELHHYIRELRMLRKTMEVAKKQARSFDDAKNGNPEELKAMEEEIAKLKSRFKTLESETAAKDDEVKTAKATSEALQKQSENLLKEYDRLLEDNQNLRNLLQELEQSLNSDGKKSILAGTSLIGIPRACQQCDSGILGWSQFLYFENVRSE
ncbi:hypothetical protein Cgig2_030531 [Carnegiea gigantea]|uniref:Endoplasmic reticulum transmembrane protein n=1 Tax=Carnegiea gigantea TaxID=171969 RepID=A0A9Q1JK54_9CARY|nr:hypothetical protein Cgig2_030531 [Carnegiea gigantea]